jgi:hypothetical protein
MNKRVILGAIIGLAVVALVIISIVMYSNNGGNLTNAVNCGSCTGCSSLSGSCSTPNYDNQKQSYGGNYQRQDLQNQGSNFEAIEKAAVEFYVKNFGVTGVTAKAQQSGCCVVSVIYKDGKPIDSLRYHGGQFSK